MLSKDLVSMLWKFLKLKILGSPLYISALFVQCYFSNIKKICYKYYYLHIFLQHFCYICLGK